MGNRSSRNQQQQGPAPSQPPYPSTILVPEQAAYNTPPGNPRRHGVPAPTVPGRVYPGAALYREQQLRTQAYQRTATIRNQVNLRKQSLRLEPVNGSKELLSISFTFDASSACRVTTFVHAREDSHQNCKISVQGSPAPPVYFSKGLGQRFPPDAPSDVQSQHSVHLGKHYLNDLCFYAPSPPTATSRTFPLIIRLEALTDEGRAEQRSLDGLQPGCELPHWVQSQSTYAKLVTEEDGSIGIRVLEQKIWVRGESYELQEIYGMDQAQGAATSANPASPHQTGGFEDYEGNECIICMSAPRNTAAIPCRHMSMCDGCAGALKAQSSKCPVCRTEIDSFLHIKLKQKQEAS
ncbi:hypothetical protein DUNSADRAFT_2423 [Dunaliella salina]|uniref:RING-type E3 ubiquitin transferase n=1 Tax=Dunaliella salina TaxID=3046 RepID=A0ABQ7GVM2_DUNSA|nr:hypothetical protein DUNSADRAFT_2423 [Dunaliella salina]|eukprot:KAF5838659.1 hypothetical protein DUNSADRAFT_2423 [Dunaliella salina]